MAVKNAAAPAAPASVTVPSQPSSSKPSKTAGAKTPATSSKTNSQYNAQDIVQSVWNSYANKTPQRTKLLDVFLAFIAVVGAIQFLYVIIVGNFPFNAFLAGFSSCVGQFVLTVSLRIQTNAENQSEFKNISHERAFADYVLGSVILHFFCINFIN